MKTQLKEKHWELGRHYTRFIDKRWHPSFVLDANTLEIFMRVESNGPASCSPAELTSAAPLFNGKALRELTIKMLHEEMAEYWSMNHGWFEPIARTLHTEMWSHGLPRRDRVYIRALVKIMRSCRKNGFMNTLISFTGIPKQDKDRYINRWLANNPAPTQLTCLRTD